MARCICWRQRFKNYYKALVRLEGVLNLPELNEREHQGLVKPLCIYYESAGTPLRDLLRIVLAVSLLESRSTLREAFRLSLPWQLDLEIPAELQAHLQRVVHRLRTQA